MSRAWLVLTLAAQCAACTDSVQHVESVPRGHHVTPGPPLRSELRPVLLLWAGPQGLVAEARIAGLCVTREVSLVEDVRVTEITPTDARWVGGAPLVVLGGTLIAHREFATLGGFLVVGGIAAIVVPEVGRRTKREPLGTRHIESTGPLVRCAERVLPESDVVLRTSAGTLEGQTDMRGRVFFPGATAAGVRLGYVDDVVAPLVWLGPR